MQSILDLTRQFAQALDRDDFAAAAAFMAADCSYALRGQTIDGREAIIASYRSASEGGRSKLDTIVFESSVKQLSGDCTLISYADHLTCKGLQHTHRCEQAVTFNAQGLICHIEHRDLPDEREALAAFFEACATKQG